MLRQRWGLLRFGACFLVVLALDVLVDGVSVKAQDVTWSLRAGSETILTTSINTVFIFSGTVNEYDEAPQAAGSLTSTATGTFSTTGNFLSAMDFGPMPAFTNFGDTSATGLALTVAEAPTLLHTAQGLTAGNMLPAPGGGTTSNPAAPSTSQSNLYPQVPAAAPASLAWIATDPANGNAPVWYESFRGMRSSIWTQGTPPALDPNTGKFDLGAGANSTQTISMITIDFNTPTIAGGFTNTILTGTVPNPNPPPETLPNMVPLPVPSSSDTDEPGQQGTLSRDGAKYILTIPFKVLFNTDADLIEGVLALHLHRTFDSVTIAEANLTPGDVNFDGVVNIFDINQISSNWSGSNPAQFGNLTPGDANGDGIVNIFDINLVSSNWTPAAGGSQAVPEPSSMALCGLGILGILFVAIRRKRG